LKLYFVRTLLNLAKDKPAHPPPIIFITFLDN
jgi:hypothetical protein